MRTFFFIVFLLTHFLVFSQNITFSWAKHFDGPVSNGVSVKLDAAGNVYTAGTFSGNVDFDPGPGNFFLNYPTGTALFISKSDAFGNFIWAKQINDVQIFGDPLQIDNNGDILLAGSYSGTIDLDPGPGSFFLSNSMGIDGFICKLDNNGNFISGASIDGLDNTVFQFHDLETDAAGNIFLTGLFDHSVDMDPGANLSTVTALGGNDIFVLKLSGNYVLSWVKQIGGLMNEAAHSISIDPSGNIFLTGYFSGVVDFDPGINSFSLSSNGSNDIFILKLDPTANFNWVKQIGDNGDDQGISLNAHVAGNLYVTGNFSGTVDFDPGSGQFNLQSEGSTDVFLLNLSTAGSFIWAKQLGGPLSDYSNHLTTTALGGIFLTGDYRSTVDFDPGPSAVRFTANGENDVFILKFDPSGILAWVRVFGGAGSDAPACMAVDAAEHIYTTGFFSETVDFDPAFPTFYLTASGSINAFVHKLSNCDGATSSVMDITACNSFELNGQTYTSTGIYVQTMMNAAGCDSMITLNLSISGTDTTLAVTACENYTWNGQLYNTSGFYRDTFTNTAGCDSIVNLNLTITHPIQTVINATICEGESYEGYDAAGTYTDTFTGMGGCDSIRTLQLRVNPKQYVSLSGTICEGESFLGYSTTGTFIDTFQTSNGCDSIRTIQLLVHPRQYTTIPVSICEGESYYAGGSYQTDAGTYRDTLVTQQGCDSVIITQLTVMANPKPYLGEDRGICLGSALTFHPGSFASYLWQDGSRSADFTTDTLGKYWVLVTDNNNCRGADSVKILVFHDPPSNFLQDMDSICRYDQLSIIPERSFSKYLWSTGSTAPQININTAGIYSLSVKDQNGCQGYDTIRVWQKECKRGIYIPTAFTPNNDGLNDQFKVRAYGDLIQFKIAVYNRWGNLVFTSTNPAMGWDGTYKGKPQNTGVYIWQCQYQLAGGLPSSEKGSMVLIH